MTSILTRGNEVRVNTLTAEGQFRSIVTTLTDGSYVVTWVSNLQDGSGSGIYSQRFDAYGNRIGAETRINTTTSGAQQFPSIAALEGGGYVICWDGNGAQAGQVDIYGTFYQIYDANGNTVGGETLANTTTASDQGIPEVTGTVGGGFAILWTSLNQDAASTEGAYMRLFSETGTALSTEKAVNLTTAGHQTAKSITTLSDGSIIATWIDASGLDGSGQGVYLRRFSASGTALTGEILVNTTTSSNQFDSAITALSNGGYVISWNGNGNQSGQVDTAGVFFQVYSANNVKIGSETLVNTFTANGQDVPSITALTDGGFVIIWTSFDQDGSTYGVFGQRLDETGAKIGPEFQVNGFVSGAQDRPSVSALNDGGFVVTWQSEGQDGSNGGIYSRRYGAATTLTGTQSLYGTIDGDRLDGGIGGDFMYGGKGSDTYIVDSVNDVVSENANQGNDLIESSVSYSLEDTNVENLTLTGMDNLQATGSSSSNRLIGNEGDNSLEGLDGNDKIYGRDGNDYINGDLGHDTLYGEDGDDEIYGLENNDLIYGGFGQDTLVGGTGNDTLYGGDDNDTITISEGIDTLLGEGGIDTLDGSPLSSAIYANLTTGRVTYKNLTSFVSGFENMTGSFFDDKLVGDAGNNVIFGDNGADTMIGGAGNDVYYYDNAGDTITENDGQGDDLLFSSVNVALGSRSVETVVLTGSNNLTFSSSNQATEVWGNSGNNNINAGLGADTIYGGLGDDTIFVDDAGDVVVENSGEGTDRISSSISYTLGSNIENLTLLGTANINGTGNILANSIVGNSGNNRLDGGASGTGGTSDSLRGGLGNDTYVFNLGFGIDDITNETGGADTILFGAGITSGMIIMQDVGADRYYAIDDGVHQASACANRIKIVGGAGGAVIETIAYTPPAAPALSPAASSAQLAQAIAALPVDGASSSLNSAQNTTPLRQTLSATSLIQDQKFVA